MSNEMGGMLPYVEIREEFDEAGNKISSEAIHMEKELQKFQQNKTRKQQEALDKILPNSNTLYFEKEDVIEDERPEKVKQERYEEITKRLDELILLEEQDEKERNDSVRSSKKIQGKGWNKGFLGGGGGGGSTKKRIQVNKSKTMKETIKERPSVVSNDKQPKSSEEVTDKSTKVKFNAHDSIKEIPSCKPLEGLEKRQQLSNSTAFSGVISETRHKARSPGKLDKSQPKKVSRFAMQRQGLL